MKKPWIVFIESNTSGTGHLFVTKAIQLGLRPVVLTDSPYRYPYLRQDKIEFVQTDTSDIESLSDQVSALNQEGEIAGILSSSEYFIEASAILASRFGLPSCAPESIRACRDKYHQRIRLFESGMETPGFHRATSIAEAADALHNSSLPLVIKPVHGSGSVGVRLCRTESEFYEHAGMVLARNTNERGISIPQEILIEEYLPGPEYSVEAFNQTVIGITRKHISPEPYFVETGHDFPADISVRDQKAIERATIKGLSALGLNYGPTHTELRLTEAGPVIIEVNPRLAGGFIPELIRLALGIDMISATLKLYSGRQFDLQPKRKQHASIRFLSSDTEGEIIGFDGINDIAGDASIVDIKSYRTAGDQIRIWNDFRDRLGHIISVGNSERSAAAAAAAALKTVRVVVAANTRNN